MAGDLEDFLKRAAERRAQKQQQAGGGGAARPKPRPRPEYTEAKRERQVRQPVEEPIPVAEVVEEPVNPLAERRRKLAEAKKKAEEARARLAQQKAEIDERREGEPGVISAAGGTPAEQLLDLLHRPGGLQQAFLLREILERPEDRW
ncbi:hypothetical protein Mal15_37850 [Stieleria maiorica]|uniref:Uncharacterized protein n=1 Tax=Stieleria maiorica TaxID=2795974 RepID=A0A5B9MGU6_9BACT|nr:hypothetical protein [Stieleria maiorica]QEF99719.1 hypothetical protein Mal15_37850 [Stieleria maiorica]